MTRIKRGSVAKLRRKKILKITSGFKGSHSRLFRTANQQALKALKYSYFDRKKKKKDLKSIWIRRINASAKSFKTTYNKITKKMKEKKIILNRKMLSEILIKNKSTMELLLKN